MAEEIKFARMLGREAKEAWRKERTEAGILSFTDKAALRMVAEFAELCYRRIEARDILKAVRELARIPEAQPFMIQQEAQRINANRLELEHVARKMEEREFERTHLPKHIKDILRGEKHV
jgi:hypothetical protein